MQTRREGSDIRYVPVGGSGERPLLRRVLVLTLNMGGCAVHPCKIAPMVSTIQPGRTDEGTHNEA
jgi:hypothetical protein